MGPQRLLRIVMPAVSLVVIAVGGVLFYSGSEIGLYLAAFGLLELLTLPFVLRMISRGSTDTEDPSYNPYARED